MTSSLMRSYVDPAIGPFFTNASVGLLKDFAKSFLVGAFGSALSHLAMMRSGYIWVDHFEDLDRSGISGARPDYAYLRMLTFEVALAEAKGTAAKSRNQLQADLAVDYFRQIEPWIGVPRGPVVPDHGFAIGSWLASTRAAELRFAHTPPLVLPAAPPARAGIGPRRLGAARLQHRHYSSVVGFLFGDLVEDAIVEEGLTLGAPDRALELDDLEWPGATAFGRNWLVAPTGPRPWIPGLVPAIPVDIAARALRSGMAGSEEPSFLDAPVDEELAASVTEAGGVIFPDGFALLPRDNIDQTNRDTLIAAAMNRSERHSGFRWYGPPRGQLRVRRVLQRKRRTGVLNRH